MYINWYALGISVTIIPSLIRNVIFWSIWQKSFFKGLIAISWSINNFILSSSHFNTIFFAVPTPTFRRLISSRPSFRKNFIGIPRDICTFLSSSTYFFTFSWFFDKDNQLSSPSSFQDTVYCSGFINNEGLYVASLSRPISTLVRHTKIKEKKVKIAIMESIISPTSISIPNNIKFIVFSSLCIII